MTLLESLSPAAQSAMINAHPRQGAMVVATDEVLDELRAEGLVLKLGLTATGVRVRARIVEARLDAAFG